MIGACQSLHKAPTSNPRIKGPHRAAPRRATERNAVDHWFSKAEPTQVKRSYQPSDETCPAHEHIGADPRRSASALGDNGASSSSREDGRS
jgi:hypothetical protein